MVLTAIPTAIHGRLGVFAVVHCRTDSLRVRISGHRPTAADASPVTYKQGVSSSSLLAPTIITPSQGHELLHRHLAHHLVVAGIAAALSVGLVSPDVVAVKARKRSQDGVTPAEVPRGRGRVVSLRERRLADLPATNRRYPPWR